MFWSIVTFAGYLMGIRPNDRMVPTTNPLRRDHHLPLGTRDQSGAAAPDISRSPRALAHTLYMLVYIDPWAPTQPSDRPANPIGASE